MIRGDALADAQSLLPSVDAADTTSSGTTLSVVITGHVDHGKSTVIGRLLADSGALPDGQARADP